MVEASCRVEECPRAGEHVIQLRDIRERHGDEQGVSAHCSCGWRGPRHQGRLARDGAWRAGMKHIEQMVPQVRGSSDLQQRQFGR
jgi:predicted RNA-binding Zn-ribbon protein involved in translation (DUF1610 family)